MKNLGMFFTCRKRLRLQVQLFAADFMLSGPAEDPTAGLKPFDPGPGRPEI